VGWLLIGRRLPGPTPLDWCALAFIGAFALSIATSVNPRVSLEASLLLGMAVVTFYMVHDAKGLSVQFWARTLVVCAAVIAVLGLVTVVIQYVTWLQQVSAVKGTLAPVDYVPPVFFRVRGVLDHPNVFAMFLNLALPFAAARAVVSGGAERKFGIAVLILGCLGVFFSGTRGAWMGTAGWAFVFAVMLVAWHHRLVRPWMIVPALSRTWLRLAILAGLLGLLAVVAVLLLIDARPDWLFRATLDDRLEAARTALAIFSDHWFTGAGPHTFLLLDDAYANRDSGVVVIVHAHNVYAQVLADLGLVGAIVLVVGAIVVFRMYVKAWRATNHGQRLYVAASLAAIAGFLVHGLSESPPSWNSVFVPFAIVLAIVARLAPSPLSFPRHSARSMPRLAMLALVAMTLVAWWAMDSAHQHYDRSLAAFQGGDLDAAADEAGKASDADVLFAYSLHAGVLRVQQYQEGLQTGVADHALLNEGIAHVRRATELEPRSALAYANLALALQAKGDKEGAVAAAHRAILDGPRTQDINTAAGTVFEWAGLRDEAVKAYAAALALDPNLAQAPFWNATQERTDLRLEVLAESGLDACEIGKAAALYGAFGDELPPLAVECTTVVEKSGDGTDSARLALILYRLGNREDARARATQASSQAPGDRDVLLSTAIVLSDDLTETRYGLLKAHAASNLDAKALLLASYLPSVGATWGISLPIEREPADVPSSIEVLVPARETDSLVNVGEATAARSITYYRWGALREQPSIALIPGDWTAMISPRNLLLWELSEQLPMSSLDP
jgi:tetratricopeptide (TPR) repeat protein